MTSIMFEQLMTTLKQEIKDELIIQFQDEISLLRERIEILEKEKNSKKEEKLSFRELRNKNKTRKKPRSSQSQESDTDDEQIVEKVEVVSTTTDDENESSSATSSETSDTELTSSDENVDLGFDVSEEEQEENLPLHFGN